MKLYTKRGDTGETSILGDEKLRKSDQRIQAYGTIDELNSTIGMLYHFVDTKYHSQLEFIQSMLFEIGSELASTAPRNKLKEEDVKTVEKLIDQFEEVTPPLSSFVLPTGSKSAVWCQIIRTVTRRAEREVVEFAENQELQPLVIKFLNRLSDLFFAWARYENHINKVEDKVWNARR